MADLVIDEEILRRLQDIAEQEHRPVNDVLRSMVDKYAVQPSSTEAIQTMLDAYRKRAAETSPLDAFLGMFDDDITDLSSLTKEDVAEAYRKKYADSRCANVLRMEQIMIQDASAEFDFTDTAIMAQAACFNVTRIATFDRRDFSMFRPAHCEFLELLPS